MQNANVSQIRNVLMAFIGLYGMKGYQAYVLEKGAAA